MLEPYQDPDSHQIIRIHNTAIHAPLKKAWSGYQSDENHGENNGQEKKKKKTNRRNGVPPVRWVNRTGSGLARSWAHVVGAVSFTSSFAFILAL